MAVNRSRYVENQAASRRRFMRSLGAQAASLQKLGLTAAQVQAIASGNAMRLIPRIKA